MRLTKHHGLGNDFLVLLDPDGHHAVDPALAVALCDRRRGVGADGLLHVTAGRDGADVAMRLLNADGSHGEMSGNGIRCVAQAVFAGRLAAPPVLTVATDAGLRTVRALDAAGARAGRFSVEMGGVKVGEDEPDGLDPRVGRATPVDIGNPHLVLEWRGDALPDHDELVALGAPLDRATPGGVNVEVVRPGPAPGHLVMVIYERGVGPTMACGTGACAAAAAAARWGLTGRDVTVAMPGGPVTVALGDPVVLTGEAASVAAVDWPWP
jgi:diaminopimelate epimerase